LTKNLDFAPIFFGESGKFIETLFSTQGALFGKCQNIFFVGNTIWQKNVMLTGFINHTVDTVGKFNGALIGRKCFSMAGGFEKISVG
jgi:hypothetical protein